MDADMTVTSGTALRTTAALVLPPLIMIAFVMINASLGQHSSRWLGLSAYLIGPGIGFWFLPKAFRKWSLLTAVVYWPLMVWLQIYAALLFVGESI